VSTQEKKTRRAQDTESETIARSYELVMAEEFRYLRSRNYKHHDLVCAIRELKGLPAGQGVKLKCPGGSLQGQKKQKAAIAIAHRERVAVRTMLRDGWLFLEKLKEK
jgi:hypothetical protein